MFEPRYLIAAELPMVVAVAHGLMVLPKIPSRLLALALLAALLVVNVSHKSKNLREDYRGACAEVQAAWVPGDHVVSLTGTFPGFSDAPLFHYLRDRADILA